MFKSWSRHRYNVVIRNSALWFRSNEFKQTLERQAKPNQTRNPHQLILYNIKIYTYNLFNGWATGIHTKGSSHGNRPHNFIAFKNIFSLNELAMYWLIHFFFFFFKGLRNFFDLGASNLIRQPYYKMLVILKDMVIIPCL